MEIVLTLKKIKPKWHWVLPLCFLICFQSPIDNCSFVRNTSTVIAYTVLLKLCNLQTIAAWAGSVFIWKVVLNEVLRRHAIFEDKTIKRQELFLFVWESLPLEKMWPVQTGFTPTSTSWPKSRWRSRVVPEMLFPSSSYKTKRNGDVESSPPKPSSHVC